MNPYPNNLKDASPPYTFDNYDGSWHIENFVITLTATDDLSGIAETYYKINYGPTQSISVNGQPLITTEGENNTLEYWSVDKAGNEEVPHKILTGIKLDKTAPEIGVQFRIPDGDVLPEQSVRILANISDAISRVKSVVLSYTANNGTSWTDIPMNYNFSSGLYETTIPSQQAGTWVKYKITAYDNAGNYLTSNGTEPYFVYFVTKEFPSVTVLLLMIAITMCIFLFAKSNSQRKFEKNSKTSVFS